MRQSELDLAVTGVAAPVREQIARALRRSIAERRLVPGQRLREVELCELTGASRTTVREALRQLEAEGLVTNSPYKGVSVAMVTVAEAIAIYEVREMLEGLAGRLFAVNSTDEQIAQLSAAVDRFGAAQRSDDAAAERLNAKAQFYAVLVAGAGNPIVGSILESLVIRITTLRATSLAVAGRPPETLKELRKIIAAVRRRDPGAAEQACREHVRNAAAAARPLLGDPDRAA